MSSGARRFTELRAWQTCTTYKRAVYRICLEKPISRDWSRRQQLENSVAGPPSHLSEGFGRFSPPDFARYTVFARSSLFESQNHLIDAVDKQYITEEERQELNALAEAAIEEVTGLMEYLLSPEALRNARRARERRIARRGMRTPNRTPENRTSNPEPNSAEPNPEPRTEHEPSNEN